MSADKKTDKELTAEIVVAYLQKQDVKVRDAEPDKIADYFDIVYQRIKNC